MDRNRMLFDFPSTRPIYRILDDIKNGKIKWSEDMDRGYIWPIEDRARFLNSIASGLPIGMIYTWNHYNMLDGNQRLNILLWSLMSERSDAYYNPLSYYDPKLKNQQIVVTREEPEDMWVPLNIFYNPRLEWEYTDKLEKEGKQNFANLVLDMSSQFNEYCIPCSNVIIHDMELVKECRESLNKHRS